MSKHKIATVGEILMRLTTTEALRIQQSPKYDSGFGGAEANVGIGLCQWGIDAVHIGVLPDNDIGLSCSQYLKSMGIDTSHIAKEDGRMGLYFLENGNMHRASKIVYDRFYSAFALSDFSKIDINKSLEGVTWLHYTGITPAVSQAAATFTQKLVDAAFQKNIMISGDINYRRNLWNYGKKPIDIMPSLIAKTHILVGDLEDFKNSLDLHEKDFESSAKALMNAFGQLKYVTTTKRETIYSNHNKLSGLIYDGSQLISSKVFEMTDILDRIGGGDAYMAGLIYGLLHFDAQKALEFGVAASVLKHGVYGDANRVSVQEVLDLMDSKNVGKLLR
ncbi:MAG: sugar kinase [Leadbetterella sp.]